MWYSILGNSNVCRNSHSLQDNQVQSIQMISIRIYDLQKVGQYHELRVQHRQICLWRFSAYMMMMKKWPIYLKPFSCSPLIRCLNRQTHKHIHTQVHTHTHTQTQTLRQMPQVRMQCIAFHLKNQGYSLTPLDISWRKVYSTSNSDTPWHSILRPGRSSG